MIQDGHVANNFSVCRDHYRLTLRLPQFSEAVPGQFLHIGPPAATPHEYRTLMTKRDTVSPEWLVECTSPMLRRAFSIAGLRRKGAETDVDIIYRVVGTATRWLESRHPGDVVSVCGPLGRGFQIPEQRSQAWVVAGGVGLPPMIWLCEALRAAGKQAVAFCGAQTRQLLPLTMTAPEPDTGARTATLSAAEFSSHGVPVVISTDDGTLGFAGHIGQALTAYHTANPAESGDLTVYACGPERMLQFVAGFCSTHGIECSVCLERAMACGIGTCQSCVVPIRVDGESRYRLCCQDGPVFPAAEVIWE